MEDLSIPRHHRGTSKGGVRIRIRVSVRVRIRVRDRGRVRTSTERIRVVPRKPGHL